MRLTVLVDNNTLIDQYYLGEPALSYLLTDNNEKILFDTGYSSIFIDNAQKMNCDLYNLNYVVLSHGHNDHTGGLKTFIKKVKNKPILVAHPLTFEQKKLHGYGNIGSPISLSQVSKVFKVKLTKESIQLTKNVFYLGEIKRNNNFENQKSVGQLEINHNKFENDYLLDDSAIVYKSSKGLVVITGCSHSGICNIIEQAKKIGNDERIVDVIGGFHLLNPEKSVLDNTLNYFKKQLITRIHPCHCTDLKSKMSLNSVCPVFEVGVSLQLEYN